MRLTLQKATGRWRISEMQEIHLEFLRMAADDASMTDCPEGRARLLPSPVSEKDAEDEADFIEDWKELVSSELEMQFAGDVGVFLSDLDEARAVTAEDGSRVYQLDLPLDHGGAWFSTLNQARLMLDKHYELHEKADSPDPDLEAEEEASDDNPVRFLVLMRYEFFAWIQEWLVRNAM